MDAITEFAMGENDSIPVDLAETNIGSPSNVSVDKENLEKTESDYFPEKKEIDEQQPVEPIVAVESSTVVVPTYSFGSIREIASFSHPKNYYFVGCKWSPDGSCILSNCADYTLRIFDLPKEFHSQDKWLENTDTIDLQPSLTMKEGGLVYDYAWYPQMSSWNPPSCCFVTTSAGSPVHLWDAYNGKIRASYRAYDFSDEVHSAISLAFSTSGEDIYCGFRNFVKIFDISKPGRQCNVLSLKDISGQKGIVSCISENPVMPELFAVGTFNKTIGLYTRKHEMVCILHGQKSGLTQVKFSDDGTKLFSGARMDNEIICWDVRNLGRVCLSMQRIVTTNQRIYFDFSRDCKYFVSGGTDGNLRIWELPEEQNNSCELKHIFKASKDCVNGVGFHPTYPILATSSGQVSRPYIVNDDDETVFAYDMNNIDSSIKMWWVGPDRITESGDNEPD